jgi:hypothetical protein
MNVTPELDLDQAVAEIADQFRAVKARNVRCSMTSLPLLDLMLQFNVDRSDAFALRELGYELVTPRLVDLPEQRRGRGQDLTPRAGKSGYHARKATVHGAWLQNPHITVDEVARLVDVHPSTARLYLRELRSSHI